MKRLLAVLLLTAVPAAAQSPQTLSPRAPSGATTISSGGTAQSLFAKGEVVGGCYIYNPLTATQQNISTAESLFVNFTGSAAVAAANGQNQEIQPGVAFPCPGPLATSTSIIAATSSHRFTVYEW
jgi:hypothetical protein